MKSDKYVIGIDLGGTNTQIGVVDADGNVTAQGTVKTGKYPCFDDYIEAVAQCIHTLIQDKPDIEGIGVGAPMGNLYTGNIENAANLPWPGIVPLASLLSKKTGYPVTVTNDANAAAIGEMKYGAAQGMKDFMVITLGTGIGSGIVAGGRLVVGHDGLAGELGHTSAVVQEGRACGCGRVDCLETYASATGMVRTARAWLEHYEGDSPLARIDRNELTSKDIYDAAVAGDKLACDIFTFTGHVLGESFCNFVAFSAPEAIILFGGVAKAGKLLTDPIEERMNEKLISFWKGKVKILISPLDGANAAILGASALAWKE